MKRILVWLLLTQNIVAFADRIHLTRVTDQNIRHEVIRQLSKKYKISNLMPEQVGDILTTDLRCGRNSLLLFSHLNLELSIEQIDRSKWPGCGSMGCILEIYVYDPKTSKIISNIFSQNVIGVIGTFNQRQSKCPMIAVMLHGSEFDRVGNDYGEGLLEYRDWKYDFKRQNAHIEEISRKKSKRKI